MSQFRRYECARLGCLSYVRKGGEYPPAAPWRFIVDLMPGVEKVAWFCSAKCERMYTHPHGQAQAIPNRPPEKSAKWTSRSTTIKFIHKDGEGPTFQVGPGDLTLDIARPPKEVAEEPFITMDGGPIAIDVDPLEAILDTMPKGALQGLYSVQLDTDADAVNRPDDEPQEARLLPDVASPGIEELIKAHGERAEAAFKRQVPGEPFNPIVGWPSNEEELERIKAAPRMSKAARLQNAKMNGLLEEVHARQKAIESAHFGLNPADYMRLSADAKSGYAIEVARSAFNHIKKGRHEAMLEEVEAIVEHTEGGLEHAYGHMDRLDSYELIMSYGMFKPLVWNHPFAALDDDELKQVRRMIPVFIAIGRALGMYIAIEWAKSCRGMCAIPKEGRTLWLNLMDKAILTYQALIEENEARD